MTLPTGVAAVTVTGSYLTAGGEPAEGFVDFTPSASTVDRDATPPVVIVGEPVRAHLVDGSFSVALVATDGWTYAVAEQVDGRRRSYSIDLPAGEPVVDLADKAPVVPVEPGSPVALVDVPNTFTAPQTFEGDVHVAGSLTVDGEAPGGGDFGGRRFVPGLWYMPSNVAASLGTTGSLTNGRLYAMPFDVGATTTFDQFGVNVTTASAGALIRLAIYAGGSGFPDVLLLDAGTVAASTTGPKTVTFPEPVTLEPGTYWLTCASQLVTAGTPQVASTNVASPPLGLVAPAAPAGACFVSNSGVNIGGGEPFPASFGIFTPTVPGPVTVLRCALVAGFALLDVQGEVAAA